MVAGIAMIKPAQRCAFHSPREKAINVSRPAAAQSWMMRTALNRKSFMRLFYEPLPHSVNVVGVCGSESCRPHIGSNLATMMRGMRDHVNQDVVRSAGKRFAFAVDVRHGPGKVRVEFVSQIFRPEPAYFVHAALTFPQRPVWPDGNGLRIGLQPIPPKSLGGADVSHQLQRFALRVIAFSHRADHLAVCPKVVVEEPVKMCNLVQSSSGPCGL